MAETKLQAPYQHQEYPKHMYGENHSAENPDVVVVNDEDEEETAEENGYTTKLPH